MYHVNRKGQLWSVCRNDYWMAFINIAFVWIFNFLMANGKLPLMDIIFCSILFFRCRLTRYDINCVCVSFVFFVVSRLVQIVRYQFGFRTCIKWVDTWPNRGKKSHFIAGEVLSLRFEDKKCMLLSHIDINLQSIKLMIKMKIER